MKERSREWRRALVWFNEAGSREEGKEAKEEEEGVVANGVNRKRQ